MKPYYDQDGITIYHGDCREILPHIEADLIITDPIWPNSERIFPGVNPTQLLSEALSVARVKTLAIQIGCNSDPRFLEAVPDTFPFIRVCWLEYACPSYQGRILNTGDIAYVFGEYPPSAPRSNLLPGKITSTQSDRGYTRWNWDNAAQRKRGRNHTEVLPHPTPRKLQHVKWLVRWFGRGSVIDPFVGSGTTLRAAKDLGIPAIGIEIEERYCEVAVNRLAQQVLPMEVAI